jgi:hypothetical protein
MSEMHCIFPITFPTGRSAGAKDLIFGNSVLILYSKSRCICSFTCLIFSEVGNNYTQLHNDTSSVFAEMIESGYPLRILIYNGDLDAACR